ISSLIVLMTARVKQELQFKRLLPSITAGLVVGLAEVIVAISFAALVFSGQLSPFVSQGIGMALVGITISGVFIALLSSLPGTVSGGQDAPVAIAAVIAGAIAVAMPEHAGLPATFATVVAFIAISTLLTGIAMLGLGYFGLGNLVRFLPYPVIGGFLAGTGWILAVGAISMLTETSFTFQQLGSLFQADTLIRWIPGVLIAVTLLVLSAHSDHYLIMPAVILGSVVIFFALALLSGSTIQQLQDQGWLLGTFSEGTLWEPVLYRDIDLVSWSVVWQQAGGAASIVLVSVVSLLLNSSGLELSSGKDIRLNRELSAAGLANAAAGLVAGFVGFQGIGLSTMNLRLKANSRLVGLIASAICLLVLLVGASFLSYFPKAVLGGLLLYLGLDFLVRWLYEAYFQLPRIDYFIVLFILVIVAVIGFLEAVAVGVLLAVILFVVGYSRVDVVKHELSGKTHRSRVVRPRDQREVIRREGDRIFILQLQGFVFFGTADNLLSTIRHRVENAELPKVRFVVIDFRRVSGIDSTALLRFERMFQLGSQFEFAILLAEPSVEIARQFQSSAFYIDDQRSQIYPSLDRAVEWCEDQILIEMGLDLDSPELPMKELLFKLLPAAENLDALLGYFDRLALEPGQYLMKQGDEADNLYIVESGQLTAQLEPPDRAPIRLETMGGGSLIGELGFYLNQKRSAAILVDKPSTVYRLTSENLKKMEKNDPGASSTLHQIVIRLMSERVTHLVEMVNALEK
ncbi:MAG: SulP family inorganic anion transporter, partial [Candidatus Promineifilaceae bacterium]